MLDPDTVEEPVAFLETAWNLVLVLGGRAAPRVILLSEDFLGAPFSQQVEEARKWRETVAHDYKHMDLGEESLVQRVCRLDGTLIVATLQTQLLDQINAFIGLGREDLEAPYFQPGVLLCMMCILLWRLAAYAYSE
ncbi:hypothetical protein AK812_SmicGene43031 [Symbiodinium microadriaticum]|uniref:Uncharacterized protein n=1 Tax=Symbiodinium microadriaticum TaxID=2951 RepID=A0A1Q9C222_SYMMI|nr:hypothetical protein AK812_SmicGene43031 [Symbiodinium microadriaticum]